MAPNPFLDNAFKSDGGRAAHLPLGMFSPMWLPFMAAAGIGAAWWTVQNWPRLIGGATTGGAGAGGSGAGVGQAATSQGAARTGAEAAAVVQSYQPELTPAAPEPAPVAGTADLADQIAAAAPAAASLTESLAVQGADEVDAPSTPAEPDQPVQRQAQVSEPQAAMAAPPAVTEREEPMRASPAPQAQPAPAPTAKAAPPPMTEREETHAVAAHDEHAKPEPELPPHEGLPARKKSGGKKKG